MVPTGTAKRRTGRVALAVGGWERSGRNGRVGPSSRYKDHSVILQVVSLPYPYLAPYQVAGVGRKGVLVTALLSSEETSRHFR